MLRRWVGRASKGDTLIEVLFAITIFSMALVASLSLMNQGTAASIRSLQITLVRQEIDSQAETLRFLNSSYAAAHRSGYAPPSTDVSPAAQYYRILQAVRTNTTVSAFGGDGATSCTIPTSSFVVNPRLGQYRAHSSTTITQASNYSQVIYSGNNLTRSEGLWIEAVHSPASNGTTYTDFHIRACWFGPGTGLPMNLGTIVRLYEPAG